MALGNGLIGGASSFTQQIVDSGGDFGAVDWGQVGSQAFWSAGSSMAMQSMYGKMCFTAGTPILWEHGHKPVETFAKDDFVYARDENDPDGPLVLKRVEELFVRQAIVWEVRVGGRAVGTTAEHPFYVQERGWTPAGELQSGDLLAAADGSWTLASGLKRCRFRGVACSKCDTREPDANAFRLMGRLRRDALRRCGVTGRLTPAVRLGVSETGT